MGESKAKRCKTMERVKKGKQNKGAQTMVRERRMCETKGAMKGNERRRKVMKGYEK